MDILISKNDLNRALLITQSIVEKKTTMPILANVLLSAADKHLRISATDFEVTAVLGVNATVKSTGSTTVNAKVFGDVVRELPDGDVLLRLGKSERLEISARNSLFKMIGVSAEEYPSLPGIGTSPRGKISSRQFLEMINKTIYAVSQDDTRFNLSGVCFEMTTGAKKSQKALRMVATDGHRLSMITRPVEGLDFEGRIIVPRKGLNEIKKILDSDTDTPVGIGVSNGFFVLENGEATISIRLIDGEFPDYNQVIPKERGISATLPADILAQALRRASLMVTDKGKGVRMDFSPGILRISSSSPELGESSEELEIQYTGKQLSVGFNARYILDIASSIMEGQKINIELNGELGPGKFYSDGDESYFGVVMPMRLN